MKNYILYTTLFLKKQAANTMYICFLILLPLCLCLATKYMENADSSSSIPVGYYYDFHDDELTDSIDAAFDEVNGRLNFIRYSDRDDMLNDTSSARLECSYILTEGIIDKLAYSNNYKNVILVYTSPQTIISDMINELVFAAVYRVAGDDVLYCYAKDNKELFSDTVSMNDMLDMLSCEYLKQLDHGNTFSIDFNVYKGEAAASDILEEISTEEPTQNTLPFHGIIAVFLFLCLLLSCSDYISEIEKGTLLKLTSLKRLKIATCFIHSWLLPASLISLLSIVLLQGFNNILIELLSLLLYYILLMLFGSLFNTFIKKSILITSLIPLLIIGSLIFTPVIIDVSAFIPAANFIEKLFLPYYYLAIF